MNAAKWDARIDRARKLAATYPFASEGLQFYERLTRFHKSAYNQIQAACGAAKRARPPSMLRQEFDAFMLLPQFPPFLSVIAEIAPAPLARFASEFRTRSGSYWQQALLRFWEDGASAQTNSEPFETMLSWLFLRPYAEYLADHTDSKPPIGAPSTCPVCSSKPQVGALRPEGDGAKRSLICALCATEWDYRRIVCPACGEEDVHKLAIYIAKEFDHVRIEACDGCRSYLKTVDLTKDGHAVPVVDELATIPLDLWAAEHNYQKLRTNLLGI
jgi:formate dehydrogenase maturation protein FdhE